MPSFPASRRAYPPGAVIASTAMPDGWSLRTFNWPPEPGTTRGSILWLGGRGDTFEKYLEAFAQWHGEGWGISSFDWRGQGGSGRLLPDGKTGHIEDFSTWIDDLAAFWAGWAERTPGPHVLMGHSMGGHLVLRALAERRVTPDSTVLSAPMLGFDTTGLPFAVAVPLSRLLKLLIPTRRAWRTNERPGADDAPRQPFLTRDADRYADELWWKETVPELELGPASWSWVAAAYRSIAGMRRDTRIEAISTPVLVIGTDGDELVSPRAIRAFAARIPNADLLMLDKAVAHEILREPDPVRDAALDRIATFLNREAPARS